MQIAEANRVLAVFLERRMEWASQLVHNIDIVHNLNRLKQGNCSEDGTHLYWCLLLWALLEGQAPLLDALSWTNDEELHIQSLQVLARVGATWQPCQHFEAICEVACATMDKFQTASEALHALNSRNTSQRIMTAICSLWSPSAVAADEAFSASPFADAADAKSFRSTLAVAASYSSESVTPNASSHSRPASCARRGNRSRGIRSSGKLSLTTNSLRVSTMSESAQPTLKPAEPVVRSCSANLCALRGPRNSHAWKHTKAASKGETLCMSGPGLLEHCHQPLALALNQTWIRTMRALCKTP